MAANVSGRGGDHLVTEIEALVREKMVRPLVVLQVSERIYKNRLLRFRFLF